MSKGKIAPSLQAIVKSLSKIVELSPDLLIFFAFIIFILSPLYVNHDPGFGPCARMWL